MHVQLWQAEFVPAPPTAVHDWAFSTARSSAIVLPSYAFHVCRTAHQIVVRTRPDRSHAAGMARGVVPRHEPLRHADLPRGIAADPGRVRPRLRGARRAGERQLFLLWVGGTAGRHVCGSVRWRASPCCLAVGVKSLVLGYWSFARTVDAGGRLGASRSLRQSAPSSGRRRACGTAPAARGRRRPGLWTVGDPGKCRPGRFADPRRRHRRALGLACGVFRGRVTRFTVDPPPLAPSPGGPGWRWPARSTRHAAWRAHPSTHPPLHLRDAHGVRLPRLLHVFAGPPCRPCGNRRDHRYAGETRRRIRQPGAAFWWTRPPRGRAPDGVPASRGPVPGCRDHEHAVPLRDGC